MIRVDMSEFMEKHAASKLIGAPPGYVGYEEAGQLTEQVRRKPFSVILFDEIEKAHPDVFNLLLQILDDGRLTDAKGRVVNFKNTIIVMTSNIGSSIIQDFATNRQSSAIGYRTSGQEKSNEEEMRERITDELQKFFKPEFINRIDEVIVFHSLTEDQIHYIVDIQLNQVLTRIQRQRGITLTIGDDVKAEIAKRGYDAAYGARPLKRVIQRDLLDPLALLLLQYEVPEDATIHVRLKNGSIVIDPPDNARSLASVEEHATA